MAINKRKLDSTFDSTITNFNTYLATSTETIRFPVTTTISENIVVPIECSFYFTNGAKLVHSTYFITFSGHIVGDPMWKIFDGTGNVTFNNGSVSYVRPEWWGVNYSIDCTASIQKAIDSVSAGGVVLLSAATYVITGPLTNNTGAIIINHSNIDMFALLPESSFFRNIQFGGSFEAPSGIFNLGITTPKLLNLTTNGVLRTSSSDGTLVVDTVGIFGPTGVQGNTGVQGDTGVQGVTGFQGQTGIQGLTGLSGTLGETGPQGVTGIAGGGTGLQGETGFQGETGIQGETGPSGISSHASLSDMPDLLGIVTDHDARLVPKIQGTTAPESPMPFTGMLWLDTDAIQTGLQGETGIQGDTGLSIQGETGVQGNTGPAGAPQGETGLNGIQGETGLGGSEGSQGETGLQGFTGPTGGEQGTTGLNGIQGETGSQGFTGPTGGEQGTTGFQGITGTQGATGRQGIPGLQGQTGAQGNTGAQGQTGIQGLGETGLQGETGLTGETGPAGAPQGETGLQGIQGETGIGAQGETGLQGETGSQGITGLDGIQGTTGLNPIVLPLKSGDTQVAAGASAGEFWSTSGHATLPNNVVMIGV